MIRVSIRHTFVVAGLVLLPATGIPLDHKEPPASDPRLVKLRRFFLERDVPIVHLAEDFIQAADHNGLDWRLLPSIAMVESSGGKYYKNNNIFGWDNADLRFRSIHSSIHEIARYMSVMRCYRGKDLDGMLWTYNPIEGYNGKIKSAMRSIDPDFKASRQVMIPAGGVIFPPSPLGN
jgi:hypothetical protein